MKAVNRANPKSSHPNGKNCFLPSSLILYLYENDEHLLNIVIIILCIKSNDHSIHVKFIECYMSIISQ